MGTVKTVVVGAAGAVGGFLLLRWLFTSDDGPGGDGWFGRGGYPGGTKIFGGGPESGPLEEDGGDGGTGTKPADGEGSGKSSDGKTGQNGKKNDGKTGADGKNTGQTGSGSKSGTGGDGKSGKGDGSGGTGGGTGGGIGDSVGKGAGDILDQWEQMGHGETEEGGGDGQNDDPNAGWGGLIVEGELPPPDLSDAKLESMYKQIQMLVWETILTTDLPPPLDRYDGSKGSPRKWWADVVLHTHYDVPFGRFDPEIASHIPWIGLWMDIHLVVRRTEYELEAYSYS